MRILYKISDVIARLSELISAIIMASMVVVVFTQVVLRFIFNSGIAWGDIYSRFSIIWSVMLYSNVLIKNNALIKVDFLDDLWPKKFINIRDAAYQVILLTILILLIVYGWLNAVAGLKSTIPGVKIKWFWVYLSIPTGAIFMLYQYLVIFLTHFRKKDLGREEEI